MPVSAGRLRQVTRPVSGSVEKSSALKPLCSSESSTTTVWPPTCTVSWVISSSLSTTRVSLQPDRANTMPAHSRREITFFNRFTSFSTNSLSKL